MASILGITVNDIKGREVDLTAYKGKVLLVVNVASKCGFTPQYTGLEELYQRYKDRGVEVLGFPSNDFGWQEPGSDADILEFCSMNYSVTFPMFSKIAVKGANAAPLYQTLAIDLGAPKWNFHKYLVGKDGQVITAFKHSVTPLADEVTGAIDAALAK